MNKTSSTFYLYLDHDLSALHTASAGVAASKQAGLTGADIAHDRPLE